MPVVSHRRSYGNMSLGVSTQGSTDADMLRLSFQIIEFTRIIAIFASKYFPTRLHSGSVDISSSISRKRSPSPGVAACTSACHTGLYAANFQLRRINDLAGRVVRGRSPPSLANPQVYVSCLLLIRFANKRAGSELETPISPKYFARLEQNKISEPEMGRLVVQF